MSDGLNEKELSYNRAVEDLRRQYFGETVASDSLKTYPSKNKSTTANADKRAPNKDYLAQSLKAHHDDGVGDVAAANRKSLSGNAEKNKDSLENIKKDFKRYAGKECSEDFPDRLMEHYLSSIDSGVMARLASFVTDNALLIQLASKTDDELSIIEDYCYHVTELENQLAAYRQMNNQMRMEQQEAQEMMDEEVLYQQELTPRRVRRSLSDDFHANEHDLMNEEQKVQQHLDPTMARYVASLKKTTQ